LYIAAGDSVPAGADLPAWARNGAYPSLLCASLQVTKENCSNVSQIGDTTEDVAERQLDQIIPKRPDLVTLTVGADDIFQSFIRSLFINCEIPDSRANIHYILESILRFTSARVVITQYYNPLGPAGNLLYYTIEACVLEGNSIISDVAIELSTRYPGRLVVVSLHDAFVGHEFGTANSWIAPCSDLLCRLAFGGIHPNEVGQREIARLIASALGVP
jgi:lysophospholipase L1-like esterase